ncbi:MAG: hypothetical protein COA43_01720 [Robiginitomaculum sp.]|nr:MAG: hypothetical protein COA43_01720 [Robiginitomaculum sp.]
MQIIEKWTLQDTYDYGKKVLAVPHKLNETGLFTDEALARLLDKHPSEKLDVCTMSDDPNYPYRHCTVDFRGHDGATLIKAVKSGQIWMNLREAMNLHPEYKAILGQLHSELETHTGKNKDRRNARGGILISSPTAKVPYHCDPTITHLWHIRGKKRVFVYPINQTFLPDTAYESIVLGEIDQDVPFRAEFEESADAYDLVGGEMVSWPHPSPHRVENQTYCISMVMEFSTKQSAQRNAVMLTNGILRRRYGRAPVFDEAGALERACKSFTGKVLRKLGAHNRHLREDFVKYKLNPDSPDFLDPVTPFLRCF